MYEVIWGECGLRYVGKIRVEGIFFYGWGLYDGEGVVFWFLRREKVFIGRRVS